MMIRAGIDEVTLTQAYSLPEFSHATRLTLLHASDQHCTQFLYSSLTSNRNQKQITQQQTLLVAPGHTFLQGAESQSHSFYGLRFQAKPLNPIQSC